MEKKKLTFVGYLVGFIRHSFHVISGSVVLWLEHIG